jgi:hypothetical protein
MMKTTEFVFKLWFWNIDFACILQGKLKMFVCTVVIANLQIEGLCFLYELRNYLHDLDMTSQPLEENY